MSATFATATVRGRLAGYPHPVVLASGAQVVNLVLDLDDRSRSRFGASIFEPRALDAIRDAAPGDLVEISGQLEMATLPATASNPPRSVARLRVWTGRHSVAIVEQESTR